MEHFDLLVVGGGINGTAIARDAATRGLSVLLVERDDLAAHTSSASSKLIHGGLRYLELGDFRLVRESLVEREILLRTGPHIVRPLQFVLPDPPGGRPFWVIRAGLYLYDLLAGPHSLPRSSHSRDPAFAAPLKARFRLATYWDAWVDDSRLVVLNAVAAAEQSAQIATRTELMSAERRGKIWEAQLSDGRTVAADAIVNAAGPWAAEAARRMSGQVPLFQVRLVKGSHIAVPRLWEGTHAYILQQPDRRVVFALPYGELSLIGTTEVPVEDPADAQIEEAEIEYLCAAANRFFDRPIGPSDIVWSYAGIRALADDGAVSARQVSRDYRLELDPRPGAKLLSVVGGKITTARALAAEALARLGAKGESTTATQPLPGGEERPDFEAWRERTARWMPGAMLERLCAAYGSRLPDLIGDAQSMAALGTHYGADLYEAELEYLVRKEWARSADDILWRRTKTGVRMTPSEVKAVRRRFEA